MEYLLVGKIIDTFSLDGSVKVISSTTNAEIRYKKGNQLYIKINDGYQSFIISAHRKSSNLDILHFEEIDDVEKAALLKGKELLAIKDTNELKEGYYFYSDLVGCNIVSDGKTIGKVTVVEEFPAQITLRVKSTNGKEFFIPFIKVFIKKVDIENKQIEINYMEGRL